MREGASLTRGLRAPGGLAHKDEPHHNPKPPQGGTLPAPAGGGPCTMHTQIDQATVPAYARSGLTPRGQVMGGW